MVSPRTVQVAFYRAVPRDEEHAIRLDPVRALDQINALKRESGEAYIRRSMYEDLLCTVHGEADPRMLVGWTIDRHSAVFVERKGEVTELELFEDEGVAAPAYGMFFPNLVFGFIRPDGRSPGAHLIAEYVEHFTDAQNLSFATLIDASVLKKLQRPAEDVVNIYMRIRDHNIPAVQEADAELHSILQAAASFASSTEIKLGWRVTRQKEKARWWSRVRPALRRLVQSGASEEFSNLSVRMRDGTIQLVKEQIAYRAPIPLTPDTTLRPETAVGALLDAYERKENDIAEALAVEFPE